MKLVLSQTTINRQTYWLGSTGYGLAFVGSANGIATEWQRFYPEATSRIDPQANQVAINELTRYLMGKSRTFTLTLDQTHGTPFQQEVWHALQQIPYGQTTTYSQLAASLDRPRAVRAVASAVGKNPLLIVVPCHRVVRKGGALGGYRGGLPMKTALLALEKN